MFDLFFEGFPKEYSLSRKVVFTKKELIDLINRDLPYMSIYCSTYRYGIWKPHPYRVIEPVTWSVDLNHSMLDYDEGDVFKSAITVHKWCEKSNYKHFILFTGRGFHVYLYLKRGLCSPYTAQRRFHIWLGQELKLNIDHTSKSRNKMSRVPNTINHKRSTPEQLLYCIPLSKTDLNTLSFTEIKAKASRPNWINPIIGTEEIDISQFDSQKDDLLSEFDGEIIGDVKDMPKTVEDAFLDAGIVISDLVPCIQQFLLDPELNYEKRWILVSVLKQLGLLMRDIRKIFYNFLSKSKIQHYVNTQESALNKNGYMAPSCISMKERGFCPENCGRSRPDEFRFT